MDNLYQEIIYLVNYLNKCTKAYDLGHPLISDKEWDDKYFQLVEMEKLVQDKCYMLHTTYRILPVSP